MLILVVFSVLYYLIGFTGCEASAQTVDWQVMEAEVGGDYTPMDFRENYAIDLKPDGYLIVDSHDGECYYVPFGQLEDWFLEMNL